MTEGKRRRPQTRGHRDGKVTLQWDKNPHWSFLGQLSDDQINEFIQSAPEDDKLRSEN